MAITTDNSTLTRSGVITVTQNSITVAVIPQANDSSVYKWVSLYPIPSATDTPAWRITYIKRPVYLGNATDTPDFDCCDALVCGLVSYGLREDGDEQTAQVWEQKLMGMVSEMVNHYNNKPNLVEQFSPVTGNISANLDARIGGSYTNPIGRY
jgi:hypothetical protein